MNYSSILLLCSLVFLSCEPEVAINLPGVEPFNGIESITIDSSRIPAGLTLLDTAHSRTGSLYFMGDLAINGDRLTARIADSNFSASALLHYDRTDLSEVALVPLPEESRDFYAIFAVLQSSDDFLYAGKSGKSVGYRMKAGTLTELWSSQTLGGGRGRAILVPDFGMFSSSQRDMTAVQLVKANFDTGDTTVLYSHTAIDSTWRQGLSGFTHVERDGQRLLLYFIRSYSEAIKEATFRLCAYDLTADSLAYELTPLELGLTIGQSTSIYLPTVYEDDVIAYQLGYQYAGFDPWAAEVLWTHEEIDGVPIFGNTGEFVANPDGIVLFPSNGDAPTCGLDVTTGEVLWVNPELRANGPNAYPVGKDHFVYKGVNGVLSYVLARTGEVAWSLESPTLLNGEYTTNWLSSFLVDGRDVYVHDSYVLYHFRIDG